ncbi:hypothetical protein ASE76_18285 [Xylophilus sp. Leaf220]|nr:hypothetical protein ASE76_18285 [Xylophilus sp. Leaf220]
MRTAFLGLAVLCAPGFGQPAFDRGLEQRLAVLRELLLRRLEFGHAGIEVRQQFFEFVDDAGLFRMRRDTHRESVDVTRTHSRIERALNDSAHGINKLL